MLQRTPPATRVDGAILAPVIACAVALKIILLFALAWNSRFVMDEFVQFGWAKYLGHGLFDTVWHAKAVGYVLFYKIAHVLGWDAVSTLLIGRLQTALLACATVAVTYASARALGESKVRALLIVLALLSFSNFIERSFRTIAEPLAVFFAASALLVLLRGRADRQRTLIAAGILSGLSFLATQKAAYFNLAMGLALVGDAALARHYADGIKRGAWLVAGWLIPIIIYCVLFGAGNPLPIAHNLFLGPIDVATTGADAYPGGLRHFVLQTLIKNTFLYGFCFAGLLLTLLRIRTLGEERRIALIFTLVVTLLVFTHDQPWPYVFIMALPFLALWALVAIDVLGGNKLHARLAWIALAVGIAFSFSRNIYYLGVDNRAQLDLVARAEALTPPGAVYFDGVGILPNRSEPSTLWLDKKYVQKTLREGHRSEAYRIFAERPPEVIIWTYRMNRIEPVVGHLVRDGYVQVSPNIRLPGRRLTRGAATTFRVPIAGAYRLYDQNGRPAAGRVSVDGVESDRPLRLTAGVTNVTMVAGPGQAYLLREGDYAGRFKPGRDHKQLFLNVYN